MATTNPFASLGLGYMGSEQGVGEKIGEALKSFGTAYLLNASGIQGMMDKKKSEFDKVPGAVVPNAAPTTGAAPNSAPVLGVAPTNAFTNPIANPFVQSTNLPPLATIDEGHDILRSGMFQK